VPTCRRRVWRSTSTTLQATYELTERGKQVVKDLRAVLKDASELYLATDEDREGRPSAGTSSSTLKPRCL